MFGFGKSKEDKADDKKGEPLKFHPELVDQLKVLQDEIYSDYHALNQALTEHETSSLESLLVAFKKNWHTYLMEKNVRLFSFLKHGAELSSQHTMDVNGARAKNTQLSRDLNRFIFDNLIEGKLDLSSLDIEKFTRRLNNLGTDLVETMRHERKVLFPIYLKAGE